MKPKRPKRQGPLKPNKRADFTVENHGSLFLMTPMNEDATQWLKEHVDAPPYMYLGQSLAVEHRYIADIVQGAIDHGFIVI